MLFYYFYFIFEIEVNDLGVVIDSRLTFHTHIRKIIVHASARANLIHKLIYILLYYTLIWIRSRLFHSINVYRFERFEHANKYE